MTEGGNDEEVAATVVGVLSSIVADGGDGEDPSLNGWLRLGAGRTTFYGLLLLGRLVERALTEGVAPDVHAYARDAHSRGGDTAAPLWIIEAVVRAARGEPLLAEGVDPERLTDGLIFVIQDLADVLGPEPGELQAVIEDVASVPLPEELRGLP